MPSWWSKYHSAPISSTDIQRERERSCFYPSIPFIGKCSEQWGDSLASRHQVLIVMKRLGKLSEISAALWLIMTTHSFMVPRSPILNSILHKGHWYYHETTKDVFLKQVSRASLWAWKTFSVKGRELLYLRNGGAFIIYYFILEMLHILYMTPTADGTSIFSCKNFGTRKNEFASLCWCRFPYSFNDHLMFNLVMYWVCFSCCKTAVTACTFLCALQQQS